MKKRVHIQLYVFGRDPQSVFEPGGYLAGFDPDGDTYPGRRANELFTALKTDADNDEVGLGTLPDGRWAIVGKIAEGELFAAEVVIRKESGVAPARLDGGIHLRWAGDNWSRDGEKVPYKKSVRTACELTRWYGRTVLPGEHATGTKLSGEAAPQATCPNCLVLWDAYVEHGGGKPLDVRLGRKLRKLHLASKK